MLARILAILPGLAMGFNAFMWITNPGAAAESLGMPLLEGLALSTQAGDFAAFFFACAAMSFLAAWRLNPIWAYGAFFLLGGAAVFRTTAWAFHGAELATVFIAVEVVLAGLLLASSVLMRRAQG